jgi:hypothetical protein
MKNMWVGRISQDLDFASVPALKRLWVVHIGTLTLTIKPQVMMANRHDGTVWEICL